MREENTTLIKLKSPDLEKLTAKTFELLHSANARLGGTLRDRIKVQMASAVAQDVSPAIATQIAEELLTPVGDDDHDAFIVVLTNELVDHYHSKIWIENLDAEIQDAAREKNALIKIMHDEVS